MDKLRKMLMLLLVTVFGLSFVACGDDDEPEDPNKPEVVDPDKPVADPEGTVTMRLRNDTDTSLGDLSVTADDNFHSDYGRIACIGTVSGLGNITAIPKTGWSREMAVEIGKGYVYYDYHSGKYYRIFTTEWLTAASNPDAIMGVAIKYQSPFEGVDEAITLEFNNFVFPTDGGEEEIFFTNSTIIPFNVKVTDGDDWCRVEKISDLSDDFYTKRAIYNGLKITAQSGDEVESSNATIEVETLYGKKTVLKITRQGESPTITFEDGETSKDDTFNSVGGGSAIKFVTNFDEDAINVSSNVEWIELGEVQSADYSRAVRTLFVTYQVKSNSSDTERRGVITISSKTNPSCKVTLNITQEALSYDYLPEALYFDRTAQYTTITLPASNIEVSCDASWCQISIDGTQLMIGVDATTVDRSAIVSIANGAAEIMIDQSKYKVGDAYDESGIVGTVCVMRESLRLVCSEYLGRAKWSTEYRITGTSDAKDGRKNMETIRKIPHWEEYYPAFALCDGLNVGGVSGWYLPASDEGPIQYNTWTSTEVNMNNAFLYDYGTQLREYSKSHGFEVRAVHRFVE